MKRMLLSLLAAVLLTGCGNKPRLLVYNWSDYIAPEVIRAFEAQYGCRVIMDNYDSNEAMYAKLKAGGTGYDIVVPSAYQVNKMAAEGMLLPLDHAKLPNRVNIDPICHRFTQDPECKFSIPYLFTSTGIGYLKDKVTEIKPTWDILENAAYKGRMTLLDDMRETLGAGLKALGYSLNTTNSNEIAAARDLVIRWKRNAAKFESIQYKSGLASAEFLVVHGYSSDVIQAADENPNIAYFVPDEGFSLALDAVVILKDAPHPDLAHAFLDFILDAQQSAANMEYVQAMAPNTAAYKVLQEDFRKDDRIFLSPEKMEKGETILDIGEAEQLYMKAWDEVKTSS